MICSGLELPLIQGLTHDKRNLTLQPFEHGFQTAD
jgi:hypothetical protein